MLRPEGFAMAEGVLNILKYIKKTISKVSFAQQSH